MFYGKNVENFFIDKSELQYSMILHVLDFNGFKYVYIIESNIYFNRLLNVITDDI